eukprot:Hpha_TRINITY_DN581_c0_g1::TRINITY_DN581_c0_g1_i1::g.171851::m.171851
MRFPVRRLSVFLAGSGFGAVAFPTSASADEQRAGKPSRTLRDVFFPAAAQQSWTTPAESWIVRTEGNEVSGCTAVFPGVGTVKVYTGCKLHLAGRKKSVWESLGSPNDRYLDKEAVQMVFEPETESWSDAHWIQFVRPHGADAIVQSHDGEALRGGQRWLLTRNGPSLLWKAGEWVVETPFRGSSRLGLMLDVHEVGNRGPGEVSVALRPAHYVLCSTEERRRVRFDFDTYLVLNGRPVYRICWGLQRKSFKSGGDIELLEFAASPVAEYSIPEGWREDGEAWPCGYGGLDNDAKPNYRLMAIAKELVGKGTVTERTWHVGRDGHVVMPWLTPNPKDSTRLEV